MNTRRHQTVVRIWRIPVILGILTAVGLAAALLADGTGDVVSWLALGVPAIVAIAYALKNDD